MKTQKMARIWYLVQRDRARAGYLYAVPYKRFETVCGVHRRKVDEGVRHNISVGRIKRRPDLGKFHIEIVSTGDVLRTKAPTSQARYWLKGRHK